MCDGALSQRGMGGSLLRFLTFLPISKTVECRDIGEGGGGALGYPESYTVRLQGIFNAF